MCILHNIIDRLYMGHSTFFVNTLSTWKALGTLGSAWNRRHTHYAKNLSHSMEIPLN